MLLNIIIKLNNENAMKIESKNVNVFYGNNQALYGINLDILPQKVTALIGPSGCGKSTFLRCINGLERIDEGEIEIAGVLLNPSAIRPSSAACST